jgi:hypothetical protein
MDNRLNQYGYVFIEGFMNDKSCDEIIKQFKNANEGILQKGSISLNDSNDEFNTIYTSGRSPLRYCYLKTPESQEINLGGMIKLNDLTRLDWSGNINDVCFPVFEYGLAGFIDGHRGRDVGYGANDFVAVLMLTEYGEDFSGGEFYLNRDASASNDGKTIFNENLESRVYFKQKKGSLLIFNNRLHVHGTNPVTLSPSGSTIRMTTSWRMTEDKL